MMKVFFLFLIASLSISYSQAQDLEDQTTKKSGKHIIRSQGSMEDVAALDEGYNEFEGGYYVMKDYLVRGTISLIRVRQGFLFTTRNVRELQTSQLKYYLQKANGNYQQVFLTNQNPSATATLLLSRSTTGPSLRERKFTGSMLTSSKTILNDLMEDKPEAVVTINKLKKITESNIRKLVKAYNSAFSQ